VDESKTRWACEGKMDENMTSNQSSGELIERFFGLGVCETKMPVPVPTSICTDSVLAEGRDCRMSLWIGM
jgi:hypothetical protein